MNPTNANITVVGRPILRLGPHPTDRENYLQTIIFNKGRLFVSDKRGGNRTRIESFAVPHPSFQGAWLTFVGNSLSVADAIDADH